MTRRQIFSTLHLAVYLVLLVLMGAALTQPTEISFTRKLIVVVGLCLLVALRIARMIYEPPQLEK